MTSDELKAIRYIPISEALSRMRPEPLAETIAGVVREGRPEVACAQGTSPLYGTSGIEKCAESLSPAQAECLNRVAYAGGAYCDPTDADIVQLRSAGLIQKAVCAEMLSPPRVRKGEIRLYITTAFGADVAAYLVRGKSDSR